MSTLLNVAVEGCCHGELDTIYDEIRNHQSKTGTPVDLLLICGDFECIRDLVDLQCIAVPQKYRHLNSFHQYVTGEKVAAVPTIFIGGNHEASNVLQSLYYGGYVAPNIYFLGFGGVVNYRGLRIAGLSGIFDKKHYRCGHYESPPYTDDCLRSVYHIRELEVFRMAHLAITTRQQQTSALYTGTNVTPNTGISTTGAAPLAVSRPIDVFLSHDWPAGIWNYGNAQQLLRKKPYFAEDIHTGRLGNPPAMALLQSLQPRYWFSGHLHVKFTARVPHHGDLEVVKTTSASPSANAFVNSSNHSSLAPNDAVFRPPLPPGPPPSTSDMVADDAELDIDADDHHDNCNDVPQVVDNLDLCIGDDDGEKQEETNAQAIAPPAMASKPLLQNLPPPPPHPPLPPQGPPPQHAAPPPGPPKRASFTQFLALDKVLPGRNFIEFLSIPVADPSLGITGSSTDTSGNKPTTTPITEASLELNAERNLQFDIEWLAVLRKTHHLLKTDRGTVHLPTVVEPPTTEELEEVRQKITATYGSLVIPPLAPVQPIVLAGECHQGASNKESGYLQSSDDRQKYGRGGRGGRFQVQPGSGRGGGRGGRNGRGGRGGRGRDFEAPPTLAGYTSWRFNPNTWVSKLGNAQTDRLLTALELPHKWTVSLSLDSTPAPVQHSVASESASGFPLVNSDPGSSSGFYNDPPPSEQQQCTGGFIIEDQYGLRAYYGANTDPAIGNCRLNNKNSSTSSSTSVSVLNHHVQTLPHRERPVLNLPPPQHDDDHDNDDQNEIDI